MMHGPINIRCHLLFYCTSYRLKMFGHYYAHHQDLATMMLITTLVVSFCKNGGISVNVNLHDKIISGI